MDYHTLTETHQKQFNTLSQKLGIFYAFSNEQFDKGLTTLNLTRDNYKDKLSSVGNGGYILKENVKELETFSINQHNELHEAYKDNDFLLKALTYELCNHEYCYTGDSTDALNALGLDLKDIPKDILKQARKVALQDS